MEDFKPLAPQDIQDNPFQLIGKEWMLVTAGNQEKFNTMTASWGGVGVLWNKNVCFIFIRPSRYTFEILEGSDNVSLSFFTEEYRDVLKLCGSRSGRDIDKCKETGLTPLALSRGGVGFSQARLILNCRKLYYQDILPENFLDESLDKNYESGDYHRMYVCEITEVLSK